MSTWLTTRFRTPSASPNSHCHAACPERFFERRPSISTVEPRAKQRRRTAGGAEPHRSTLILQAARGLFYERGFHGVSVDEIGEAAGATGAAVYRHFTNKAEILATLFDEAQDRYLLAMPGPRDDPHEELELIVSGLVDLTLEERELGSIWAHERRALSTEQARRLTHRMRNYYDQWVTCLRRIYPDRADPDLRDAADAVVRMVSTLTAQPGRHVSAREAELHRRMAITALSALAEPR